MANMIQPKPGPSAAHVPLHAVPPRAGRLLRSSEREALAKLKSGLVIGENRRQGV